MTFEDIMFNLYHIKQGPWQILNAFEIYYYDFCLATALTIRFFHFIDDIARHFYRVFHWAYAKNHQQLPYFCWIVLWPISRDLLRCLLLYAHFWDNPFRSLLTDISQSYCPRFSFRQAIFSALETLEKLYDALTSEPQTPNEIADKINLNQKTVQGSLLELINTKKYLLWSQLLRFKKK